MIWKICCIFQWIVGYWIGLCNGIKRNLMNVAGINVLDEIRVVVFVHGLVKKFSFIPNSVDVVIYCV